MSTKPMKSLQNLTKWQKIINWIGGLARWGYWTKSNCRIKSFPNSIWPTKRTISAVKNADNFTYICLQKSTSVSHLLKNLFSCCLLQVLINKWITRFGVPIELRSDHKRSFDSALIQGMYQKLSIQKTDEINEHKRRTAK